VEGRRGAPDGEERLVTLALDAEGGDNAPKEIVAGALQVASATLKVLLVGRPEIIGPCSRVRSGTTWR